MSVEMSLHFEGRVVYVVYTGAISADEIRYVLHEFTAICDRATVPILSLSDTTEITNLPDNIFSLLRVCAETFRHPKAGTFVIVMRNVLVATIVNFWCRIIPTIKVRTVSTIDQGWLEINQLMELSDTTLKTS